MKYHNEMGLMAQEKLCSYDNLMGLAEKVHRLINKKDKKKRLGSKDQALLPL